MSSWDLLVPMVIEQTGRGEREYDIFSRLLKDRIIFLGDAINDVVANVIIAQMLFLQMENKSQDINLYINSPGGTVTAGLAIYDTMQFVRCDVATYCIGQAYSIAAILLAAGAKGKRFTLPYARIMLHQPSGGIEGAAQDLKLRAEEIVQRRTTLAEILATHSHKSREVVLRDIDREFFLSAEEARDYGLVDEVVQPLVKSPKKDLTAPTTSVSQPPTKPIENPNQEEEDD